MLGCYEETVTEKRKPLSHQMLALYFFKPSSGICASLAVLLDIGEDDSDDPVAVQDEMPSP